MHIVIISHYNQYSSKAIFSKQLKKALEKRGHKVVHFVIFGGDFDQEQTQYFLDETIDLFISFNSFGKVDSGHYFWDLLNAPMLLIFVDAAIYFIEMLNSPNVFVACIDKHDLSMLHSIGFNKCFYLPHATCPKEQIEQKLQEVVFLATAVDPLLIEEEWKKSFSHKEIQKAFEVTELYDQEQTLSIAHCISLIFKEKLPKPLLDLHFDIEWYIRGKKRIALMHALEGLDVHIYGEGNLHFPGARWEDLVPKSIHVHPSLTYDKTQVIYQHSRIVVNSSPFFKEGTHERVFDAMSAHALALTNRSGPLNDYFNDMEDLLFYDTPQEAREKIEKVLKDEELAKTIQRSGTEKVNKYHTWDQRAEELLKQMALIGFF
jgi:glycosyltransferase involved in cell wall biosynthesis